MSKTKFLILSGAALIFSLGAGPAAADTGAAVPAVVEKLTSLYGKASLPAGLTPQSQKDPLGHLVGLQRLNWPQAWVASTFYDWRTVSKYRRNAGLHLGYDIAMPFGVPVSAGWGGVVTAVVPWTNSEWGVTVTSPTGLNVTYGHISPSVSVGQAVAPGQAVGRIASDHVDVKMRDPNGRYIPFGEGAEVNAGGSFPTDRNTLLTAWLVAKSSAQQAEDDLFYARNATQKWALERRAATRTVEALDRTLSQIQQADKQGLISRRRLEELKAERATAQKTLDGLNSHKSTSLAQLTAGRDSARATLASIEAWALAQGLSWKDVENLVQKTLAADVQLQEKVRRQELEGVSGHLTLDELTRRVKTGKEQLKQLEELYQAGGLSRAEIEDRRLRQELLEEELHLRSQRK